MSSSRMMRIEGAADVLAKIAAGGELFEDNELGAWVLHENGIRSLTGRMFEVTPRAIEDLKLAGRIEREEHSRHGGRIWRVVDPTAKSKEGSKP